MILLSRHLTWSFYLRLLSITCQLLKKKRMDLLPLIARHFERAVDESHGVLKAFVKSASALDEKSRGEIEKKLSLLFKKQVSLETSVDPELLAGIVIQAGDTVIDNSLKSQLRNLSHTLE